MNYDMKLYDWGAKNQRLPYRVSHEKGFHDLFWSTIFLVTGTAKSPGFRIWRLGIQGLGD